MTHKVQLVLMFERSVSMLNYGISFVFEKERYTPYTTLTGKWYCPSDTSLTECRAMILYIDQKIIHYGFPTGSTIEKKDGRIILNVRSRSFTSALSTNQCADEMLTNVNLETLVNSSAQLPNIQLQKDTPEVNYVNYSGGTSIWEAVVCYALRATALYPYIGGYNTVMVDYPQKSGRVSMSSHSLIARSNGTDYGSILSSITMSDVDGTPAAFETSNSYASQRGIIRNKDIPFDKEWAMDPDDGLNAKIDYSLRAVNYDSFSFLGVDTATELLDSFVITDLGFSGEVDRIRIIADSDKGLYTEISCYHDMYCL